MIEDSNFELSCLIINVLVGVFSLLGVRDSGQELLIHLELCFVHALIKVLVRRLHSNKVLIDTEFLGSFLSSYFFSLKLLSAFLLPVLSLLKIGLAHHIFLFKVSLLLDVNRLKHLISHLIQLFLVSSFLLKKGLFPLSDVLSNAFLSLLAVLLLLALYLFNKNALHSTGILSQFGQSGLSFTVSLIELGTVLLCKLDIIKSLLFLFF
jgi:hypothetical protein